MLFFLLGPEGAFDASVVSRIARMPRSATLVAPATEASPSPSADPPPHYDPAAAFARPARGDRKGS